MNYTALQDKFQLNKIQLAHFLGQLHHESAGFTRKVENLNYSAKRLLEVFPRYFTRLNVNLYANKPEMIGNAVYSKRMGNSVNEGYKFRGRGYIMLTGKNNYKAFSEFIGEDCVANPDLVATKYPFEVGMWFFEQNKIFDLCKDISVDTITKVSKRVNGGTIGLQDRIKQTLYYYREITKQP